MFRFGILLGIVGVALLIFGINESRLSSGAKSTPQRITCAELAASGPGSNAYVTLTDYMPSLGAIVVQKKNDTWEHVWVPLYVARPGGFDGIPSDVSFPVILDSTNYPSKDSLVGLAACPDITGMIVNRISSLGTEERNILKQNYPGVNFDTVLILQDGRKPKGAALIIGMIVGGLLLAVGGAVLVFKKFRG